MTMNELVEYIAEDLNTPSLESKTRIGHELNVRYKQVTSSIGLITSRRQEFDKQVTIGNRFVVFTAEKLDTVFISPDPANPDLNVILDELTNDEMVNATVRDEPPTQYSIFSSTATTVTVVLDCVPTTAFHLYAHGLADATTLTGNDQPAFPESFHDILIQGVRADEYRRKEKTQLAREAEDLFQNRLSDLRMFIAKSAYLDIYRGKHSKSDGWWDVSNGKF